MATNKSLTKHFKGFSVVKGDVKVNVSFSRMGKQYQRAQFKLDTDVFNSMEPFMPMNEGNWLNVTRGMSKALAGTGIVVAAAPPQGRELYEGKTMVDEATGSPWARKGAKKVLVSQYSGKTNAKEDLIYSTHAHPKATDHWFEPAKKQDLGKWVNHAKKVAGGGTSV